MEPCRTCGVVSLVSDDGVCGTCRDPRWRAYLAVRLAPRRHGGSRER